jgi:hypothetical protein
MKSKCFTSILFALFLGLESTPVWPQGNVIITPLGAAAGEFCVGDRALLFQDPTGVTVLIAPGRTVDGPGDGRLPNPAGPKGGVHALLIDHPHVDHVGDVFHTTCSGGPRDFAEPGKSESNAAHIAAVHNSAVLVGGELPDFFTQKIANAAKVLTTKPPVSCPAAGLDNTLTVPLASPCVGVIRGGTRTVVFEGETKGVKITTIPAFHAAGASRIHIDPLGENDPGVPEGLTGYAGHETGYIIRFTNGLTVLWTGDSGLIGDWETQSKFYRPNLAIVHMGDLFTMGPDEAAFAVNQLIKPRSVIPEHANQESTKGGVAVPGTRLERFISQVKGTRVVLPLSGIKIACDGKGNCQ